MQSNFIKAGWARRSLARATRIRNDLKAEFGAGTTPRPAVTCGFARRWNRFETQQWTEKADPCFFLVGGDTTERCNELRPR